MKKNSPYFKPISTKVVITNIFMTICVFVIVIILVLIAQGYSLGESGGIERSGLLELRTKPGFTNISIDDKEQFYQGNFSKVLPAKEHAISVTKDGYDTWTSNAKIDSGLVTSIDWIRLFPKSLKDRNETIAYLDQSRFMDISPNRKYLVYLPKASNEMQVYDLESNKSKPVTTYNIAKLFTSTEVNQEQSQNAGNNTSVIEGNFSITSWNNDGDKFILKVNQDDVTTWSIINIYEPSDNINLSNQFSLNFSNILLLNDSATKMWGLENSGVLRILESNKNTVANPIDTKVKKIASYKNTIAYTKQTVSNNQEQDTLYIYKENAKKSSKVKTFGSKDYHFCLGHHNKDWLAFSDGRSAQLLTGNFPTDQKIKKTMKKMSSHDLTFTPNTVMRNLNSQIIIFSNNKQNTALYIPTLSYHTYDTNQISSIKWLDSYINYNITEKKIIVRDFNGYNQRTAITDKTIINNSFAAIPKGSNSIYYLTENRSTSNEDSKTNTTKNKEAAEDKQSQDIQKPIILKRIKL